MKKVKLESEGREMIKIQKENSTDQPPVNLAEYSSVSEEIKAKIIDAIAKLEKSSSINKGHLTNIDSFRAQAKTLFCTIWYRFYIDIWH